VLDKRAARAKAATMKCNFPPFVLPDFTINRFLLALSRRAAKMNLWLNQRIRFRYDRAAPLWKAETLCSQLNK
jgi:hypothetical protein